MECRLYFNTKDPNRPIECKYTAEINGQREYFVDQHQAILYLYDNGVQQYRYLTKEYEEYKDPSKIMVYEIWHIGNRLGYVLNDYEQYLDDNGKIKKRKAYVWRFVGSGRSCFAPNKEELKEKITRLVDEYKKDLDDRGYNTYPFYTRYYRNQAGEGIMDFIAFDFETANSSRHSICSVGMVFVENGQIVDTVYQLIDPEEDFDGFNISIHGIRPEDVEGAPTFVDFYEQIKPKIENKLMVAHYLAFDGYALRDNLNRYEITPCFNQFLCTYQLSRKLIRGQSSYQLNSLCHHFEIDLINHHHALDDAKACANLMLKLISEYELSDFDSIYKKTYIRAGEISENGYRSSLVSSSGAGGSLDLRTIEVSKDADPNSAFHEKNVVFTGKLNVFTRKEAAELVAKRGGVPQNGVTKETNYIITGSFEEVMINGNKSSKLKKAEKLINEGQDLEIIGEEDFYKML